MVQPTGLAVLDALGLAEETVARGAAIRRLYGKNREGEPVLEAEYAALGKGAMFGIGIHRASLFDVLFDAVRAEGIALRTGHEITGTTLENDKRLLQFAARETSPAHDLVVDALGVGSPLSPSEGHYLPFGALWTTLRWPQGGPFDPHLLEQRYENAGKMIGVLPTGRRAPGDAPELALFWSLKVEDHPRWLERGLDAWKADVLDLWPDCESLLPQIAAPSQLTFARYAHRTNKRPAEERIVHIGDSWHAASPQLGQGANMALLDARALAQGLSAAGSLDEGLARAVSLRRSHVRLYQWMTRAFTPLYQSDKAWHAALRDLFFAPASRIAPGPRIKAALVSGLAGSPLGALDLALPDYDSLAASASG